MSVMESNDKGLIVPLHAIKGGKTNNGEDWLSGLATGTRCLVKRAPTPYINPRTGQQVDVPNYELMEIEVELKKEHSVSIQVTFNGTIIPGLWVDPKDYCKVNYLHELLEVPGE